ncbi:hypothetical protein G7Y89_g10439 [Cudoniella acicularis]|uniref:Heterokaryon incompatibility domain-containing protein n=1 Tax=Cudoniella acicularis TaxID=354080 RepID=A0A8H4RF39_9HELO|nr:hypothetical protein G7Y89_g10439 [Cudoniella acicularis]
MASSLSEHNAAPGDLDEVDLHSAFQRNPVRVRKLLLEAIRQVDVQESDLEVLLIEKTFESTLKAPPKISSKEFISALRSYSTGDATEPIKSLFYEQGKTYGLLILTLVRAANPGLQQRIERLGFDDQVLLLRRLLQIPPESISRLIIDCVSADDISTREDHAQYVVLSQQDNKLDILFRQSSPMVNLSKLTIVTPNFKYFPNPEWCDFRLVLLERAASETSEIRCHLISASMEENFQYEALSYTWGDASEQPERIWINDKSLSVTTNLLSALKRLRKGGTGKYRFLCIDSLCIDQNNPKDRNDQVAIMGQIYQNAQRVTVWLGEHDTGSDKAIDFIMAVHHSSSYRKVGRSTLYTYQGKEKYEVSDWKAVDSLFRRDYWERTWIIQEIELAKNVLVYCGDRTFNWRAGSAFYDFLQDNRDRHLDTDPGSLTTKYPGKVFEPDYQKPLSEVYYDALKLELTPPWQIPSVDLVHYSYFLQKILSLSFRNSEPPFAFRSIIHDQVVVVGFSGGKLIETTRKHPDMPYPVPVVCALRDSQFFVRKEPQDFDDSRFTLLGPLDEKIAIPEHVSGIFEAHATEVRAFTLPTGQTVLAPEEAQSGDEIILFPKHDSAIVLHQGEGGKWELVGNALVLTTDEKRN